LFVGDIRIALKNLETILAALVRVPALHLAVVGDTRGSPYPARAAALGLAGRVHFLGFRNDVAAIMQSADLFVFPSRYESFSLVLLEAMAAGLPVITARTVGAASLVTPGSGMVLDNPNDAGGLAACMQQLTASAPLRARMGLAAREIAVAHSWRRMTDQYMALYQEAEAAL
jgi:glycosyltransferase involved in cell wall biosynthesis